MGTNNGVLVNGAGFGAGEVGQAFAFTGDGQAVDVGYATNLQIQTFTIEAWIKRYSTTVVSSDPNYPQDGIIFGYGANGYAFALNQNKLILTKVYVDETDATNFITDTAFHHVAVTVSNGMVTFYQDEAKHRRTFF